MKQEQELLVSKCKEKAIIDAAKELKKLGFTDGTKYYSEGAIPYFKILKPFKRESENDPDVEMLFLDVEILKNGGVEYTVYTQYCHEHYPSLEMALHLLSNLYYGQLATVVLVYPNRKAASFVQNLSPKKNVNFINENADFVISRINSDICFQPNSGHIHEVFPIAHPFRLLYCYSEEPKYSEVYLVSKVVGEHPEVYIIK